MSLQPAYVLHHWAWSETSLVVDLFTRGHGRVAVVAKGAKRPYSQLRSVLLPFQRIAVALGRASGDGGGDIVPLRSAEYAGGAAVLGPQCLLSGFYLNELLLKLLARHDAHERLFDAYGDALASLAVEASAGNEAALRAFELRLLKETGVLPQLDRCTATQEPVRADRGYVLRSEAGLTEAAPGEAALSGEQCRALHAALEAGESAALHDGCSAALPVLKSQLRALLHYHLGSSRLHTRQAMIEVRRLLEPERMGFPR